jgi:hypothetical protein
MPGCFGCGTDAHTYSSIVVPESSDFSIVSTACRRRVIYRATCNAIAQSIRCPRKSECINVPRRITVTCPSFPKRNRKGGGEAGEARRDDRCDCFSSAPGPSLHHRWTIIDASESERGAHLSIYTTQFHVLDSGYLGPMLLMITTYQFTNISKFWRDRDGHTAAISQPRYDLI